MDMKVLAGAQRVDFPAPVKITMPVEVVAYLNRRQADRENAELEMKAAQSAFQAAQIKHTSTVTAANVMIDFVLETHGVNGHPYSITGDDIIVQLPTNPRAVLRSEVPGVDLSENDAQSLGSALVDVQTTREAAEAIIGKKNCKYCGNEFTAFRRQVYCDNECRIKFNKEQKKKV
jgi:hypothetical protein